MLSKAEQLVADQIVLGISNKEIGERLFICEKTVKFHAGNIYAKAGVKSRAEFIAKQLGKFTHQEFIEDEIEEEYSPPKINGEVMLESGSRPIEPDKITTIQEARAMQRPLDQGARQVQVIRKSQEEKITFIDEKFRVGDTIQQLHNMMKEVTSKELSPNTVNAACNCVARLNETINTAIQAARFLNER